VSNDTIVLIAEKHVRKIFKTEVNPAYAYHNLQHTLEVVRSVRKMAKKAELSAAHLEILELAALFHDLGYCQGHEDHEAKGALLLGAFLRQNNYSESSISVIQSCIQSTKVDVAPDGRLEQMLCDADLHYLGTRMFFERGEVLRKEWENTLDLIYDEPEWLRINYEFLAQHRFYTPEAIKLYGPTKKTNMLELQLKMHT